MHRDSKPDNDLAAASGGDADALQRLIVLCHKPLHGVVSAAIDDSLRHRVDPDDVLQQAYVAAFKALNGGDSEDAGNSPPQFETDGHFYRWLETIAINQLRDLQRALRRKKRDVAREIGVGPVVTDRSSYPELIQHLAAADQTPSRQVRRDEAIAAVMTSLARLPDKQRTVIRQRFLQNVPFEQIAEELGKSKEAVYVICHRGLKSLRGMMVSITRYLTRS